MALVRPKPAAIAEPSPRHAVPLPPHLVPGTRSPLPLLSAVPTNGGYLRRCTYRRVELARPATRRSEPAYAVTCLYPDHAVGSPLGDLASARAICDGCAATGIFRPDED